MPKNAVVFESMAKRRRRRVRIWIVSILGVTLPPLLLLGTALLILWQRPDWVPADWRDALVRHVPLTARIMSASAPVQAAQTGDPQLKEIEQILTTLQLTTGPADGFLDPDTIKAIEQYQQMAGLPVTGKPSAALLDELKEVAPPAN